MASAERKKYILKLAARDGIVSIPAIAEHYNVSVETIRRDVNSLCEEKKLTKVHGGAVPVKHENGVHNSDDSDDTTVGAYCAGLIGDGEIVMFDSGSAAQAVAADVSGVRGVTFITNSVPVAVILMKKHSSGDFSGRIILIGGELDPKLSFSRSPDAFDQIGRLSADKAFITASGVTSDGASSDGTYEGSFSAKIMEHSKTNILVCDSGIMGKPALAKFASLNDFDYIVCDNRQTVPSDIVECVKKKGHILRVAAVK